MEKEIVYFTMHPLKMVIATRPQTGSAIIFKNKQKVWAVSSIDYYQISSDGSYSVISQEQAQSVFGNIPPDTALLDRIDSINMGVIK
ncbi:hypothetical protein AGMMS50293_13030 [Spirochaetia bacterium]|nr:hypothetical protein AGMMS50293_13030 [Spirochaetia bacterium]